MRIVTVRILVANLSVWSVDHHLALLVDRDLSGYFACFSLRADDSSSLLVACPFYCPSVTVRHDVLILSHATLLSNIAIFDCNIDVRGRSRSRIDSSKIHSNDVATVAAEFKGDGAHHGAVEGGRQSDDHAPPGGVEEEEGSDH